MTTLEKIRAEIEEERVHDDWNFGQEIYYNNAIDDVLQIIDKYADQEPCDDAVSRQAVLQELTFIGNEIEPDELTCIFRDRIKQLPSVRPQEQTGKWILQYPKGVWTNNYECSRCGGMVLSCEVDLPKYCGHCGAKMLKGEE